jgi:hypothetical protein
MPRTLENYIRQVGAPDVLSSDNANKGQIGAKVCNILCHYSIGDQQSEPYHQHQKKYAEQCIQEVSHVTNMIIDRTGTPSQYWLLSILYVVYLLSHMVVESLHRESG